MLRARRAVQSMEQYSPPLDERSGLRLDFNENCVGCSPRVLARLCSIKADDLACYPERKPVETLVASFLQLLPEQVLLTNGVDEAIHLLCETYLDEGDEVLLTVPSYSMYRIYAGATGARIVSVPGFHFPLSSLLAKVTDRTRLIVVANPNNPTGALAAESDLLQLAESVPQAAVLVDEAYYEFSGRTVIDKIAANSNLFVARTFSKAYGMAGLRIGILGGPVEQMQMLRKVCSPYNVNQVALKCLPDAVEDQEYVNWYVDQVKSGRSQLEKELRALEIEYWPSHANFVLARIGDPTRAFVKGMKQQGVLVRDRSSDFGCKGWVRISVGTKEHTARLIEALRLVWSEIAVRRETAV
jgi:histidinol-phosphate aminotransferase